MTKNPLEDVQPHRVGLIVRGRVGDLIRTNWISEGDVPEGAKFGVVVVSIHSEILGVVYPPGDRDVVSFVAKDLAFQAPWARSVNVSRPSNVRRGAALNRPESGTYQKPSNAGVRELTKINRRGQRSQASLRPSTRKLLEDVGLAPLDRNGGSIPGVPAAGA